jgi:hypothetical protein
MLPAVVGNRYLETPMVLADLIDRVWKLIEGNLPMWIGFGVIFLIVVGIAITEKITGTKAFSKEARREGRRRRKHILWEYERDKKD